MTNLCMNQLVYINNEEKLDPKETVVSFHPTGMVLRSHSQTGRSESTRRVENIPERCGGAPRPETEIAQPKVVDVLYPGRDPRDVSDSPGIDSRPSGEIVETLSGPSFPDRQKPEMENTPSVLSTLVFH